MFLLVNDHFSLVFLWNLLYAFWMCTIPLNWDSFWYLFDVTQINTYIPKVINEINNQVEVAYRLGFKAIVVTNLEPIGCLPLATFEQFYFLQWYDQLCNKYSSQFTTVIENSRSPTQISYHEVYCRRLLCIVLPCKG